MKKYYSGNQLSLLMKKGVYPYDYVDSMKNLNESKLPPKEVFYSALYRKNISDADYQHAQTVGKSLITR